MGQFTYDSFNSSDFDLAVKGEKSYTVANRKLTTESLPGVFGEIITDTQFENVTVTYDCSVLNKTITYNGDGIPGAIVHYTTLQDIVDNISDNLLLLSEEGKHNGSIKYRKLTDSWHPGEFRMAVIGRALNIKPLLVVDGEYTAMNLSISFKCKPQRFLDSGDEFITVNSGDVLHNPTGFRASPLLQVTGKGTIIVDGQTIIISADCPSDSVTIDCETMDAYNGTTNLNKYVELPVDDIVLTRGQNKVTYTGITSLQMKTRWWRI